jgi:hypothetical protein
MYFTSPHGLKLSVLMELCGSCFCPRCTYACREAQSFAALHTTYASSAASQTPKYEILPRSFSPQHTVDYSRNQ